jgi:hypothetical protein
MERANALSEDALRLFLDSVPYPGPWWGLVEAEVACLRRVEPNENGVWSWPPRRFADALKINVLSTASFDHMFLES